MPTKPCTKRARYWFSDHTDNEFQTPRQIASANVPDLSPLVPILRVVFLDSYPLTAYLVDLTTLDTYSPDTLL